MKKPAELAYFSMEIALEPGIPTYSGGLGVLAGDTLRSYADLGMPVVAVSLVHRRGYFRQRLGARGGQREEPEAWNPEQCLEPLPAEVSVEIEGRSVRIGGFVYRIAGPRGSGGGVSVLLLDSDRPGNRASDRRLTDRLYGGDERLRLCQEVILGIAGLRMLRALGHGEIERFHLNEGHAALVAVGLMEEQGGAPPPRRAAEDLSRRVEAVRARCVFTTHTPVPAGHDRFSAALSRRVLGAPRSRWVRAITGAFGLDMTQLALATASRVSAVAMRHGEVSRRMFPGRPFISITNGIHAPTWATPAFRRLFDRHLPGWRADPLTLRHAVGIPLDEISNAHSRAKRALLRRVSAETGERFDPKTFTIGFARRATAYKRATLLFHDLDRLAEIAEQVGAFQIVLAGKAHPKDREGKAMIRSLFRARDRLRGRVRVAYLENYEMELAGLLCGGADLWLNTPIPPLEASGTSGMKAALNGVPSLSTLDGWWVEGCVPGVTGWAVGDDARYGPDGPPGQDVADATAADRERQDVRDAHALLETLAEEILPCFYASSQRYATLMRSTIAINASFFNTQRMALQYLHRLYR